VAFPLEASLSALGSYAVEATSCSDSLQDWSRFSLVTNDLVPLVHLRFSKQSLTKMNQGEVLSGRIQQGSTATLPTIIDLTLATGPRDLFTERRESENEAVKRKRLAPATPVPGPAMPLPAARLRIYLSTAGGEPGEAGLTGRA
jgi:hypothetical protein